METEKLEYLREWVKELTDECADTDLLDLICRLLVSEQPPRGW